MRSKGYTVVPDWVLEKADLDIYETLVLAVIYGFSQDGESTFAGSQAYLARKCKCSKTKVANVLARLVEKDLVEKIEHYIQGVKFCEYRFKDAEEAPKQLFATEVPAVGKVFRRPTVEEVAEYCKERGNGVDAERFCNYYDANGWKVGKNAMKDWKAAVRTWEKSNNNYNYSNGNHREDNEGNRDGAVEEMFPTTL